MAYSFFELLIFFWLTPVDIYCIEFISHISLSLFWSAFSLIRTEYGEILYTEYGNVFYLKKLEKSFDGWP